jgi:hypothetical protein
MKNTALEAQNRLVSHSKQDPLFTWLSRENTNTVLQKILQGNTTDGGFCFLLDFIFRFSRTIPMC